MVEETDVNAEATEDTKRKEIPSHDAWGAFIGQVDISKLSVEEANAFVDKFGEWLELQRQIEEADKKIAAEKDAAEKSKLEEEKLALEEKAKQLEEEKNVEEISFEPKTDSASKDSPEQSGEWSKTEAHWKKWCSDKGYIYDQSEEDKQKEGLAFRYYSSPEKQAAGESEVRVHYVDKNLAKVVTNNGKPASFEFWRSFAEEADKSNRIINFDKTKNTENQAKLYLACKILGVETSNVDESKLNFENAFKEMSEEDRKKAAQMLGLDENGVRMDAENSKPNENSNNNGDDSSKKDYAFWRKEMENKKKEQFEEYAKTNKGKGTVLKNENGKDVETFPEFQPKLDMGDFEGTDKYKEDDIARAYLAAKSLGYKIEHDDIAKAMHFEDYIEELPKIDQIRLMVNNKKETGFYHEEDSIIDQGAEKRKGSRNAITESVKNKEAGYEVGSESLKEKRQETKLSKEVMERALSSRSGK